MNAQNSRKNHLAWLAPAMAATTPREWLRVIIGTVSGLSLSLLLGLLSLVFAFFLKKPHPQNDAA